MSYVPTGTSRKMYSPLPSLCVSRRKPWACFVITTLAAATVPPLESVTVPRIRPPVLCANVAEALIAAQIAIWKKRKMLLQKEIRKDFLDFMDSPLSREIFFHAQHLRGCCAP